MKQERKKNRNNAVALEIEADTNNKKTHFNVIFR